MKSKWWLLLIFGMMLPTVSISQTISFQGVLNRDGEPLPDAIYIFTFRIYDHADGGNPLWTERQAIRTTNGIYSVKLGAVEPLRPALDFIEQYWISVQLPREAEMDRLPIQYGPYCFYSLDAGLLGGVPASSFQSPPIRHNFEFVELADVTTDWAEVARVSITADSMSILHCEAHWADSDRVGTGMQIMIGQDGGVVDMGAGSFNNPIAAEIPNQTVWDSQVEPGSYDIMLLGIGTADVALHNILLSVTCIPLQAIRQQLRREYPLNRLALPRLNSEK